MLSSSYRDEKLEDGSEHTVLALPPFLALVKLAILPLVKKDGLPNKAMEIFNQLRFDHNIIYEEMGSIGKRYRRQDAIGTPYRITIDHETLTDNAVTLRNRDTMKQERVAISELPVLVERKVGMRNVPEGLG